jgi:hypothetical protein
MKIVGCDLHARQQSIAMLDTETGELTEKITRSEGNAVRDCYAALEDAVVIGIETTGSMQCERAFGWKAANHPLERNYALSRVHAGLKRA